MRFDPRTRLLGGVSGATVKNWLQRSASGVVQSVQRGTVTISAATSATATISAVVLANSRLRWLGQSVVGATQTGNNAFARLELTNTTTVTASVIGTAGTVVVSFEVVEYVPGVLKSVQRGTVTSGSTATITAVDPAKTCLDWLGCTCSAPVQQTDTVGRIVLTNSTTVTGSNGGGGGANVSGYQAAEFY